MGMLRKQKIEYSDDKIQIEKQHLLALEEKEEHIKGVLEKMNPQKKKITFLNSSYIEEKNNLIKSYSQQLEKIEDKNTNLEKILSEEKESMLKKISLIQEYEQRIRHL